MKFWLSLITTNKNAKLAELERAARDAESDARVEEQRRVAALQEIADEALQRETAARADADAATAAGGRLRQQISRLTASCRAAASNPATAGSGPSADATADLLAQLQQRLDEAADGIARFADRAHAAGAACQSSYNALMFEF
jgi:hypothetical protein